MNHFLSIFAAIAVFASQSVPAFADSQKSYSADAIELANVLKNCTSEVSLLSSYGPANTISSAVHDASEDLDTYTIEFSAGGLAPSFKRFDVGTLKISRAFVPSVITAPDAPGGSFEFKCQVEMPIQPRR